MIFKDLINQIERDELVVSYTCTSYTGYVDSNNKGTLSGTCNSITEQAVPLSEGALSSVITENINIGVGITHEYTLTLLFKEINAEQNYNQGKDVNTEINITQVIDNGSATRGNIYNVLLADNPTIKNDSADLFADVADEVLESGLFRTTDLTKTEDTNGDGTGEEVLYFRGVVENNYLVFAGFCWRIVRTNESGESIKLRYGGEYDSENNTCPQTGTNVNTGVYYSSWYNKNIATQGERITNLIIDEPYCRDESISNSDKYSSYYIARTRLQNNSPQFKCSQETDKYTVASGKLTEPIFLLTADEVAYAGGKLDTDNNAYYLYTSNSCWTKTPDNYYDDGDMQVHTDYIVSDSGAISTWGYYLDIGSAEVSNMAPVISLSNTANIAEGTTGEYNNPYIVVTE